MGQSPEPTPSATVVSAAQRPFPHRLSLAVFSTELGWFGLLGTGGKIAALSIGHSSSQQVQQAIRSKAGEASKNCRIEVYDWNEPLRRRLQRFAQGTASDFTDVELALPPLTDFQRRVLDATRAIPYGKTTSYAELAGKAGSPRAARAVGNVMASNRVPIIIACHRVIAAGGRFGGFSAPQGVDLKIQLLDLEAGRRQ